MRWSMKDARGAATSAFVSGGLFSLPWLIMALGVYAEVSPATDIVVEIYEPLEAVYLQMDPPPLDDPEVPLPEDPEVPEEPVEEEVPEGAEDGDEAGTEEVDEEGGGEEGSPEEAVDGEVDGEGKPKGSGLGGEGAEGDGAEKGDGEGTGDPKVKKKGKTSKCNNPHPNVRPGDDGIIEVDRSLVNYYTHSLNRFMELGYSEPYEREGTKGFLIGGFSCTSPVYKAGLRKGDMLITVNGKKTRTWVGVYLLYKKLSKETDFEIVVLRRGATTPTTLRFRVVES